MRTFSEFFAHLGCPIVNIRWSWSAVSTDGTRAIFTIWSDEIKGRKYVLYPTTERRPGIPEEADHRLGAEEIARIAHYAATTSGVESFGVLTFVKDTKAKTRVRDTYDDNTVFRLRVEQVGDKYVAHLVDRPSALDIAKLGNQ